MARPERGDSAHMGNTVSFPSARFDMSAYTHLANNTVVPQMRTPGSKQLDQMNGRGERIRTSDSCVPNAVLYQAELHPENIDVLRTTRTTGSCTRGLQLYLGSGLRANAKFLRNRLVNHSSSGLQS